MCSSTYAITGNFQPDTTPYVGIVVVFSDAARTQVISVSTGILLSPTVVLTAGHSVIWGQAASVCFDQGPITYSIDDSGKISFNTNQPIYNGNPIDYQEYADSIAAQAKASEVLKTSDVGLILLNTPVQEVTSFPTLPAVGITDVLPAETALQVIGYGFQYQVTPKDNGVQNSWTGTLSRNSAILQLLSTNFKGSDNYLKCSANAAQGKGGVAYGDSGGPVLLNIDGKNTVLAINAYVDNANCAGVTYHTRIDTYQVLAWINSNL
jgi:hypothetical protein